MEGYMHLEHGFAPVFDENSRVLVLGSFPSVKSRENGFYYGHPQNRFWRVLSRVTGSPLPESVEEKKRLLLQNGIALWDVIASCDIIGSGDSSIRNVRPNELSMITASAPICRVAANGAKAYELYKRYYAGLCGDILKLPSTSPANAAVDMDALCREWGPALRAQA